MTEIREWLQRLYSRAPGWFTLVAFDNGRPRTTKWYSTDQLDRAANTIQHYSNDFDIYTSVATHKVIPEKGRGSLATVTSIPGMWADLDIGTDGHKPAVLPNPKTVEQALSILDGLPAPSATVHTGGGLQVWWLFDQPWVFSDPTEAATAAREWQELLVQRGEAKGLHVDSIGDLPRILRVPGTRNHKTSVVRPVSILPGRTPYPVYPIEELSALGVPRDDVSTNTTAGVEVSPLGEWADILGPHGWSLAEIRASDKAELWVRPGKSKRDGHSAVANPYGVPVLVNFSATSGLPTGPGQRLTKYKVWAALNFNSDMRIAKLAYDKLTKDTPDKLNEIASRFLGARLNWRTLWTDEDTEPDWLIEPLAERGRLVAFYSEPKAGKSLLWLEVAAALATGRPCLGNPAREPINVLYIDKENTRKDIRERLGKMGYEGCQEDVLGHLHYYSFPDLAYFDSDAGGRELFALATHHDADLSILDTLSRVVEGGENEPDTYIAFYQYTGIRFKAAGRALLRLDHSGKDLTRGMRGASAKRDDVDEVWQLSTDDSRIFVDLTRTHSRSYHGENDMHLQRLDDPLRHEVVSGEREALAEARPGWFPKV